MLYLDSVNRLFERGGAASRLEGPSRIEGLKRELEGAGRTQAASDVELFGRDGRLSDFEARFIMARAPKWDFETKDILLRHFPSLSYDYPQGGHPEWEGIARLYDREIQDLPKNLPSAAELFRLSEASYIPSAEAVKIRIVALKRVAHERFEKISSNPGLGPSQRRENALIVVAADAFDLSPALEAWGKSLDLIEEGKRYQNTDLGQEIEATLSEALEKERGLKP